VEAALELFAVQGFDSTSTKQIAAAAGVAEGLIFHHFKNKLNLLAAIFETHHSYFQDLQVLLREPPDVPVGELLARIATEALDRLRRESRVTVVFFVAAQTNAELRARLERVINAGTRSMGRYLAERRAKGELRDLDVESAAFAFLSPLFLYFLAHRDLSDRAWRQRSASFAASLVGTWLQGARARE
jgi:AcrR family transcriptional regulator